MTPLLPPNATNLERALAMAVQGPALPLPLRPLWSPDDCPDNLLPWLAWALSIDNWDPDWPDDVRRDRVRQAIAIQRRKGTRQSVEDVIAVFGGSAEIREWWETTPPGDPYTFGIVITLAEISGEAPTADYIAGIIAEVALTKPLRSRFSLTLALSAAGRLGLRAAARAATFHRLTLTATEEA